MVKVAKNSLNNRFIPYDVIETDAIFAIDDDVEMRHDEILLAYRYVQFVFSFLSSCWPYHVSLCNLLDCKAVPILARPFAYFNSKQVMNMQNYLDGLSWKWLLHDIVLNLLNINFLKCLMLSFSCLICKGF